ncbi:MAG: ornithine carbamoyltransferase [Acidobacteriaceae bacterium]|nr:ornithine carbamoyltransferase [Acidobacteriaceae bacterium]MBV9779675.1 ornithine carbamoyltransferase [Acidobacteriaceae bacterium]
MNKALATSLGSVVQLHPGRSVRSLLRDADLSIPELKRLLDLTQQVKNGRQRYASALRGRYLSLLFEKPSLRTRMTFELAIKQLGGDCVLQTGMIADREPLKDVARNLARWTDAIVARTYSQETIEELARWSGIPVVNALSDLYHPCQALADMFTLKERFGQLWGLKLAYVGDGNNMAHSLLLCCARLGISCSVATPPGYEPKAEIAAEAKRLARESGVEVEITHDPSAAVRSADAVYTDVWASMGHESEIEERKKVFSPYQVNEALLSKARKNTVFMHCMPAKRGLEVTDSVMESAQSVAFEQAENRLHVQKALLLMLLQ